MDTGTIASRPMEAVRRNDINRQRMARILLALGPIQSINHEPMTALKQLAQAAANGGSGLREGRTNAVGTHGAHSPAAEPAVLAHWPELEAQRSLLSQVQIEEQERKAYERLSQVAAGRVERLLDLLKQEVAP
ncbi:hypothetical protein [Synechococcus sp. RedBA-s]|uniref:hypothetical protein n=1 Tax=Synechococcus sp. RedBA-s TaxID=2823741 RepID=UPI0020CCC481|nr:hypothetical protein [Synechococcus sp. RedBA-s]MCP9801199.1 hypothetical protein [Synechococcus sp. RedBA-s]